MQTAHARIAFLKYSGYRKYINVFVMDVKNQLLLFSELERYGSPMFAFGKNHTEVTLD